MITQDYLTISPAYGKDYKSKKQVQEAFDQGRDFRMESLHTQGSGSYCSKRDFKPGTKVNIRYKRMTQVTTITA